MTRSALVLVSLLALTACAAEPTSAPAAPKPRAPAGMPFVIEKLTEGFAGRAAEVLQVSGYTYVAVESAPGEVRWVVSLQKDIEPGAPVSVRAFGKKREFASKQLGRTFEVLWFGIVTKGEDQ